MARHQLHAKRNVIHPPQFPNPFHTSFQMWSFFSCFSTSTKPLPSQFRPFLRLHLQSPQHHHLPRPECRGSAVHRRQHHGGRVELCACDLMLQALKHPWNGWPTRMQIYANHKVSRLKCVHRHMYVHILYIYIYACVCVYVCMSVCLWVCVCVYVCMHGWMDACMHACMYLCIHVFMYVNAWMAHVYAYTQCIVIELFKLH